MRDYLRALDGHLTMPTRLIVIGGAAVALGWDEQHATSDIDLFNNPGAEFLNAVEDCISESCALPVSLVGIASPPYDFEDRLVHVPIEGLQHLRIFIPEAHDLVLMKLVRGEAHDLDAIESIHRIAPLSLDTLLARYLETRVTLIGPMSRLKVSLLALVGRLFGEHFAAQIETDLDNA